MPGHNGGAEWGSTAVDPIHQRLFVAARALPVLDKLSLDNKPNAAKAMPNGGGDIQMFFFQAEDGIRDYKVTGVQTCALPICAVLEAALAKDKVVTQEPITASEDFSAFVAEGIPGFYLTLGGADPQKYEQAKAAGTRLPSNHSPLFAPDIDPALHTAITAEVAMLRDLLRAGAAGG